MEKYGTAQKASNDSTMLRKRNATCMLDNEGNTTDDTESV
jgi:hypothetical protein